MSPGGHRTLPNGHGGSLGLRWRLCVFVCVHICAGNVHPHMDAHMYCVRSIMVVFLTQSACVFVTASVFIEGKCPELFFFFFFFSLFFTLYFQTHTVMTLSIWNIKNVVQNLPATLPCCWHACGRLLQEKKKKKNTKDLCNTQHENKFLDLNMESDSGFHTEAVKYNQEQRGNPKCS